MKNNNEKVKSSFLKNPKVWQNLILGTVSVLLVIARRKVSDQTKEINLLRRDNERLGRELNKSYYFIGKLQAQKEMK